MTICFVNIIVVVFIYSSYAAIFSRNLFIYLFTYLIFLWYFLNLVSWMLHVDSLE